MSEETSPNFLIRLYQRRDSLRVQALLFTALPLAILLGVAVAAVFFVYQQVATQLALSRDHELARVSADRLSENMAHFVLILTTLSKLDIVNSGDPALQKNALTQARDLLIDFDGGVIVLNPEGIVTVTEPYRPDLQGQDFSDRPYFQQTRQIRTFTFSDIVQEPGSGEDIIVVAVPIISQDGSFQGVLAGRFYLQFQRIGEEIRKLHTSELGEAYLIDRNGRVVYHPDYSLIGADFSQRVSVSGVMQGEREGAVITEWPGGRRQVVGYDVVEVTGWALVVQEPWAEVVAPAVNTLRPIIIGLLAAVALLVVIVLLAVQRVTSPITQMAAYSRQVAAGDYAVQVPPYPIAELRDMGNAFNEMVKQISRYQAGLRQYVAAITNTQEEERRRIARDLHDDTTQSLIAIGQRVELARDMIDETPQEATEQLSDLRKMITRTINSVRQFSRDLRPTTLEDLGLVAALQHLVNTLSHQDNMEVSLSIEGTAEGLLPEMEIAVYRIVQEALTNIRKHARASHVQLQAQFLPQLVIVTVRDNGVGFEVPQEMAELANQGSFGLMGLKERAQLFGGQATITSQPEEGTEVQAVLPRHWHPAQSLASPTDEDSSLERPS
jgi:signal transduction histidine kinase